MNEFRGTPAPWTDRPRRDCIPICGQEKARISLGFINSNDPRRVEEGEANAKLIAVSPLLLAALQKLHESLSALDDSGDAGCMVEEDVETARAAIALVLE